jgi:PAS domain S-box-containing protein
MPSARGGTFLLALRIATIYALAGSLWVLGSDRLLHALVKDPAMVEQLQTAKGWAFVLLSAVLIYWLTRSAIRRREAMIADLRSGREALAASEHRLRGMIEQLKSLNSAYKAKQKDYGLLFSANPQPMWIYEVETLEVLAVNDAAVAYYGYSRDEWLTMRITDFRPKEDIPRLLEHVQEERIEAFSDADIWTHIKKDGSPIQVEISAHAMSYEGRAARVVTAVDVTERMRLQAQMEESEARYRSIFQNNHAVMLLIDPADERIVDANPAAERFYGYGRDELCQMPITQINTLGEAEVREEMEKAKSAGRSNFEFRHRLASGAIRDVEVYSGPAPAGGRELLYSIVHDATEKRRAVRALQDAEARFRALVEQSVVGTYIVDDGAFSYASPRMEEMFGYQPGGMVGLGVADIVAPVDREMVLDRVRKRLSGEELSAKYEFHGRRRDGTEIMVEVHGTVTRIDDRLMIIGVANDVTERSRIERRELDHLRRAEEAMLGTITIVSRMIELRDPYTAGHERRVAEISVAIGEELGLDTVTIEGLRLGASIHDIGKIAIPADILSKPGKLSAIEYEYVKHHAAAGYQLLAGVTFPWPLADIVHQHHERIDGSGYPQGLTGDSILLEARILAVADTVEAMASHRPYRPSRGIEAALEEIERQAGIKYDPEVARVCLRLFREKDFLFTDEV